LIVTDQTIPSAQIPFDPDRLKLSSLLSRVSVQSAGPEFHPTALKQKFQVTGELAVSCSADIFICNLEPSSIKNFDRA
jgi:hypothetical protein